MRRHTLGDSYIMNQKTIRLSRRVITLVAAGGLATTGAAALATGWTAEATPGGGLTMVISLPLSAGVPFQAEPVQAPLQPQSAVVGRHHAPPILSSGTDAV